MKRPSVNMAGQLDLVVGPQLVGAFFNWGLLGVLNIQTYLYYTYFPNDRIIFKLMVYGILILEWVHTGLVTSGIMTIYLYNFGNPLSPAQLHNSWFAVPVMCAVISMIVQAFLAWRIYIFSKSSVLAGGVILLSISQGAVGIAAGVLMKPLVWAEDIAKGVILPLIIVWISGAAAVDIIIAITMTTLLLRSRSGIPRSDALVHRMVQLVVETGTLTAGCAVVMLVLAKAPQTENTLLYEVLSLTITKVYANTFLTNLNSRARMQDISPKVHISLGPLRRQDSSEASGASGSNGMSHELPSFHKGYAISGITTPTQDRSKGTLPAT